MSDIRDAWDSEGRRRRSDPLRLERVASVDVCLCRSLLHPLTMAVLVELDSSPRPNPEADELAES
jgi:hypothetical protein